MIILLSVQIRVLRLRKGWSQAELARRVHISPSAVGMYEQGRRQPSVELLVALSKEFDVTIDYLVAGRDSTNLDTKVSVWQKHFMETMSEIRNLSREELLNLLMVEFLQK